MAGTDLAEVGVAFDSSGLIEGAKATDDYTAANVRAKVATDELTASQVRSSAATTEVAAAQKTTSEVIQDLATRSGTSFAAMEKTVTQMASGAGVSLEQMATRMTAAFERSGLVSTAMTESTAATDAYAAANARAAESLNVLSTKQTEAALASKLAANSNDVAGAAPILSAAEVTAAKAATDEYTVSNVGAKVATEELTKSDVALGVSQTATTATTTELESSVSKGTVAASAYAAANNAAAASLINLAEAQKGAAAAGATSTTGSAVGSVAPVVATAAIDTEVMAAKKASDEIALTNSAVTDSFTRMIQGMANRTGVSFDEMAAKVATQGAAMEAALTGTGGAVASVEAAEAKLATTTEKSGGFFSSLIGALTGYGQAQKTVAAEVAENTAAHVALQQQANPSVWGSMLSTLFGYGQAHSEVTEHVKESANEHFTLNEALKEVGHGLHALHPELAAAGVGMGELTSFSRLARGGIAFFAAAVAGTLIVELVKAGQELENLKDEFNDVFGEAGPEMFEKTEAAAKSLTTTVDKLAPSVNVVYDALRRAQINQAEDQKKSLEGQGLSFAPGEAGKEAAAAVAALNTQLIDKTSDAGKELEKLSELFKAAGESASESAGNVSKFYQSMPANAEAAREATLEVTESLTKLFEVSGKGGIDAAAATKQFLDEIVKSGLTSDQFNKLTQESRDAAAAIAEGFGFKGPEAVDKFGAALERVKSVSFPDVVTAIRNSQDMIDDLEVKPGISQSWNELKIAFKGMFEEVAKGVTEGGGGGAAATFLKGIADGLKEITPALAKGVEQNLHDILVMMQDLKAIYEFFKNGPGSPDSWWNRPLFTGDNALFGGGSQQQTGPTPSIGKPGEGFPDVGKPVPPVENPMGDNSTYGAPWPAATTAASKPAQPIIGDTSTYGEPEPAANAVSGKTPQHPVFEQQVTAADSGITTASSLATGSLSTQPEQTLASLGSVNGTPDFTQQVPQQAPIGPVSNVAPAQALSTDQQSQQVDQATSTVDQLNTTLGKTGDAADRVNGSIDQLNTGITTFGYDTAGAAQNAKDLATGVSDAGAAFNNTAQQIPGSINTAQSSLQSFFDWLVSQASNVSSAGGGGGSGSGGPQLDNSSADIGSNATGGIYTIGTSGGVAQGGTRASGTDTINLTGTVSPGEIVAIIPPDKANQLAVDTLSSILGDTSVNSIGGGSVSGAGASNKYADFKQSPNVEDRTNQGSVSAWLGQAYDKFVNANVPNAYSDYIHSNMPGNLDVPGVDTPLAQQAGVNDIATSSTATVPYTDWTASDYGLNASQPINSPFYSPFSADNFNNSYDQSASSQYYDPYSATTAPAATEQMDVTMADASQPDNSLAVDIGSNATGGVYTIGSSGGTAGGSTRASGTDTINLTGTVSPGEVIAVIPADKANQATLNTLQTMVSTSPISIGGGSVSGLGSANTSELVAAAVGSGSGYPASLSDPTIKDLLAQIKALMAASKNPAAQASATNLSSAASAGTPQSTDPFAEINKQNAEDEKRRQQEDAAALAAGRQQQGGGARGVSRAASSKSSPSEFIKVPPSGQTPAAETAGEGADNASTSMFDQYQGAGQYTGGDQSSYDANFTSYDLPPTDTNYDPYSSYGGNYYEPVTNSTDQSQLSPSDAINNYYDPFSANAPADSAPAADAVDVSTTDATAADTVDIGSNATGGVYTIGSGSTPGNSGTLDALNLVGKVSPGEVVAVIPPGADSSATASTLSSLINTSVTSVGGQGAQTLSLTDAQIQAELAAVAALIKAQNATSLSSKPAAAAGGGGGGGFTTQKSKDDQSSKDQQQAPARSKPNSPYSSGPRTPARSGDVIKVPQSGAPAASRAADTGSGAGSSMFDQYTGSGPYQGGSQGSYDPNFASYNLDPNNQFYDPFSAYAGGNYGYGGSSSSLDYTNQYYDPYSANSPVDTSTGYSFDSSQYYGDYSNANYGDYSSGSADTSASASVDSTYGGDTSGYGGGLGGGDYSYSYGGDTSGSGGVSADTSASASVDTSSADVVSAGDYAEGGAFTVPDAPGGGTDTVATKMNLTGGETVAIFPAGVQPVSDAAKATEDVLNSQAAPTDTGSSSVNAIPISSFINSTFGDDAKTAKQPGQETGGYTVIDRGPQTETPLLPSFADSTFGLDMSKATHKVISSDASPTTPDQAPTLPFMDSRFENDSTSTALSAPGSTMPTGTMGARQAADALQQDQTPANTVHVNVFGVSDAQSFIQSRSAIQRSMRIIQGA